MSGQAADSDGPGGPQRNGHGDQLLHVAQLTELVDDQRWIVTAVGSEEILTLAAADRIYAVSNFCPHALARLTMAGDLNPRTLEIECRYHTRHFSLTTGEATQEPCEALRTYEVTVEGDDVFVRVPADLTD